VTDADGVTVKVQFSTDALFCQREARAFALSLGFSLADASALAIAVSELVWNVVLPAGMGIVRMLKLESPPGVEVVVSDRGPGSSDVGLAVRDGFSRGRFNEQGLDRGEGPPLSLGCGLGAVKRLTDLCEIESGPEGGTTVTVRKYLSWGRR